MTIHKRLTIDQKFAAARVLPGPPAELLFVNEMAAAILLPAAFVGLRAEGLLFAVADGLDAIASKSRLYERVFYGVGAIGAESEVVFGGATLVAVSLNRDADVGMLLQEAGIALNNALVGATDVVLVIFEINIFHVLREEFFFGCVRGFRWRRGRGIDGHASGGILSSAGAFGDEMIGGRIGRSNLARTAHIYRADAVDADVTRIRGLPAQRGGLA